MKYPMSTLISDGSPTMMFKRLGFDPTLISVLNVNDDVHPKMHIVYNMDRIHYIEITSNMTRYYKSDVARPYDDAFHNLSEWMVFSGMKDLYSFVRSYFDMCVRHYLFPNGIEATHPFFNIQMKPVPSPYALHVIHQAIRYKLNDYNDVTGLVNGAILSHPNMYPVLYTPFHEIEQSYGVDSITSTFTRIIASDEDIDGFVKFTVELKVALGSAFAAKIDDVAIHEFNKAETKYRVAYMTCAMLIGVRNWFVSESIFINRYQMPVVTARFEGQTVIYRIEFNIKPELRWSDRNVMTTKVSELMSQDQSLPSFDNQRPPLKIDHLFHDKIDTEYEDSSKSEK